MMRIRNIKHIQKKKKKKKLLIFFTTSKKCCYWKIYLIGWAFFCSDWSEVGLHEQLHSLLGWCRPSLKKKQTQIHGLICTVCVRNVSEIHISYTHTVSRRWIPGFACSKIMCELIFFIFFIEKQILCEYYLYLWNKNTPINSRWKPATWNVV